jgi:hypothetical protein
VTKMVTRDSLEISMETNGDHLRIKEQETDAVIKGEFVVGIISKDLLSILKIPMLMTLITKNNFIDI